LRRDIKQREIENKRIDDLFVSQGKDKLFSIKPKLNDTQKRLLQQAFECISFGQKSRAGEIILEISKTVDDENDKKTLESIACLYFGHD
jgi:hypothetical protein